MLVIRTEVNVIDNCYAANNETMRPTISVQNDTKCHRSKFMGRKVITVQVQAGLQTCFEDWQHAEVTC